MSDLIRRIDAMQACQVAPSDEWSKATKGGYNQAATDCAMALLKCEPVPPTLSAAMELPEVKALVHAVASQLAYMDMCGDHGDLYNRLKAALAAIKEPKT